MEILDDIFEKKPAPESFEQQPGYAGDDTHELYAGLFSNIVNRSYVDIADTEMSTPTAIKNREEGRLAFSEKRKPKFITD